MKTKFKIPIINASKIALKSFLIVFIFGSLMVYKRTSLDKSIEELEYQVTLSKDFDDNKNDENEHQPNNNRSKFDHLKNLKYLINATCHIAQQENSAAIKALEDDNKRNLDNVKGLKSAKMQNTFLNQ